MATIAVGGTAGGLLAGGGVAISWPAILAGALIVIVVAIVAVAVVALVNWITSPSKPRRRPIHRRCNLRPESPPGTCEYACYLVYDDGTMDYDSDIVLTHEQLSRLLGVPVTVCPPFIISPL